MVLHVLGGGPGNERKIPLIISQIKRLQLGNFLQHDAAVGIEHLVRHKRWRVLDHAARNQVPGSGRGNIIPDLLPDILLRGLHEFTRQDRHALTCRTV